jgi:CubicO group peptidase (beta-lactamase class C family)
LKSLAERDGRVNLITARRVLSHTTGFQNEIHPGQEPRIHFHPGARFSYSGEGFHYLQRAIERITGERIDVVFQRMIFAPLRMESASFLWQAAYEQSKAYGHNAGGTAMERVRPAEVRLSWLHLTSIDYAKFLLAAMNEVRTSRGPTNLMLSPQVPIDESCVFCLQSAGEPRSRSLAWGLGWGLEHVGTRTAIWHWGENRGEFQHFVIAYPREGTGLVIFTNSGNGFSIIPEIVSAALGGRVPASFAWLRYDRYDAPGKVMYRDILSRGVAAAEEHLGKLRAAARDGTELLSEPQVNQIGYWLLSSDRVEEAIRLFRFNVEQHPASWNAYDSLAEAHALQGDRVLAIENYAKAVELNPHNQNAIEQLRRLRQTP